MHDYAISKQQDSEVQFTTCFPGWEIAQSSL